MPDMIKAREIICPQCKAPVGVTCKDHNKSTWRSGRPDHHDRSNAAQRLNRRVISEADRKTFIDAFNAGDTNGYAPRSR